MKRKLLIFSTAFIMLFAMFSDTAFAQTGNDEKIKKRVSDIGIGPQKTITVKLKDKRSVKGYISGISDSEFTITDSKTFSSTIVAFSDVHGIKRNRNVSGKRIAAYAAIVGLITVWAANPS